MGKAIVSAWSGHHAVAADSQRELTRNSGQGGADNAADLSARACAGGAAANSVDGEAKSHRVVLAVASGRLAPGELVRRYGISPVKFHDWQQRTARGLRPIDAALARRWPTSVCSRGLIPAARHGIERLALRSAAPRRARPA
jgi:hypothetical protein